MILLLFDRLWALVPRLSATHPGDCNNTNAEGQGSEAVGRGLSANCRGYDRALS